MNFTNKIVWITGASSGIGEALTLEFSKQGATLILSSRNEAALKEVRKACVDVEKVKIVLLNLEEHAIIQEKVAEAVAQFGRIDVLVNNGGVSQRSLASETSLAVDRQIMDVNYIGTVALTKALLPHFIQNKSGQFVVTTSIVGKIGTPLRSSYAASKHALHGFFDSLRAEIYKYNISVCIVCPGFVNTNVSINALTGDGSPQQKMDIATQNGMDPNSFAKLMIRAVLAEKEEVYIAGFKEKLGVYLKRYYPKLLSKMIRKMRVT
jgi:short-subunit dehydrogenase